MRCTAGSAGEESMAARETRWGTSERSGERRKRRTRRGRAEWITLNVGDRIAKGK